MATLYTEIKVHSVGSWPDNDVTTETIARINHEMRSEKGHKVHLLLYRDGLRIVKTQLVVGKTLQEFLQMNMIHFMTASQNAPEQLLIIAQSRNRNFKYQIYAFKCANGQDANTFLNTFRSLRTNAQPGHGLNAELKEHDGINWTLRGKNKEPDSKRELKQLVNFHDEKAVIQTNGGVTETHVDVVENPVVMNTHIQTNGYVDENDVTRIPLYRKAKQMKHPSESDNYQNGDISDAHSETSEAGLRAELDTLSQELRNIKVLLENSTGLNSTVSSPSVIVADNSSPRAFKPVNVTVHKHTHTQNEIPRRYDAEELEAIDAIVLTDDEPSGTRHATEFTTTTTTAKPGNVTHVRVAVPDYRAPSEPRAVNYRTTTETTTPRIEYKEPTSNFGSVASRTSTTSYENWKRHHTTTKAVPVQYNDMAGRVQWKSRSQTVPRPRTVSTNSTDTVDYSLVKMRHRPRTVAHYKRVPVNPRVARLEDRKSQSMRVKGFSTTVAKPIEKVYVGRHDVLHSSIMYKPNSRPTILVDNEGDAAAHDTSFEQNNNVVKVDDKQLLDVSGVDLYRDTTFTPISNEAVIRT